MLRIICVLLLFLDGFVSTLTAQVAGCTDPQALNFNPQATLNNGSCTYSNQSFNPSQTVILPDALVELSGMVYWEGFFWGHNDGGNGAWLYAIDTLNGGIQKVIGFVGATNADWEDLAQDSTHFYIGDFGNNANGNRKNLKIYKVPKDKILGDGDTIMLAPNEYSIINFSYPDQTSFAPTGANKTRFDCEAMFFHRDSLHLITKNWIGNFSVHYSLPIIPGTYSATRHDSLNTAGFLITGADIGAEDQIMLTAYNSGGACILYLIYGFDTSNYYFETGNKRRINLPSSLSIGQLESVCYINGIRGAIGSEKFQVNIFNVAQNMRRFTTHQWVIDHYMNNSPSFAEAGMMRFNAETDTFEYYNGFQWLVVQTD
jgi:hypothetical protein